MRLAPLPESFAVTRAALHRLAVYVISPAQRLVNGEIIMRATPGGFSTFPFEGRVIGVDEAELIVDGARHPIGSLNAAARIAGITPDVDQQEQFDVPPHGDLDAPLAVDAEAARALGAWFAYGTTVLEAIQADAGAGEDASMVRIWPEHFDAAMDVGDQAAGRRATYGASPGDGHHAEPYLYASPWAGRIDPFFADAGFRGAARTYSQIDGSSDAEAAGIAFLREARGLVGRHA